VSEGSHIEGDLLDVLTNSQANWFGEMGESLASSMSLVAFQETRISMRQEFEVEGGSILGCDQRKRLGVRLRA
jgi:hypothetical protein